MDGKKRIQTKPNAHNRCYLYIFNYNRKNCKINVGFDHYTQNLDISDNVVVSLDKTSLTDLWVISVVQLNASSNYISDIDEEAFLGQSKLQTVDLSSNSLMYIEPKTFIRSLPSRYCSFPVTIISDCLRKVFSFTHNLSEY